MQDVINDPILLIQQDVQILVNDGFTFEGTVLNVATTTPITFLTTANSGAAGPTTQVAVPQFGGGTGVIQFLGGQTVTVGSQGAVPEENAQTAVVYATFWIEKVTNTQTGFSFMQLQYAQMVVLDFPIFHLLNPPPPVPPAAPTPPVYVNLGWPHISVATLRKTFS